ncbi:alpha-N-acetylglucosaminidase [Exophiala aquamarina CBS 119918]|uniref:Alpha-N-acetylglucosaminidase n=1 Tax=Exophiala aquamarina CBS 119918 TaxID=1182545 RepID=A0A072NW14_9EURO|nr:alpha-N-acetylglucosaminidase [Exophiala aquamarina CBS 119918]KEF52074.1 alpha-N-acetylglucosaminidase [Exophiala aquamarina CBS 119918]
MHPLIILPTLLASLPLVSSGSIQGLTDLVKRHLSIHAEDILFVLHEENYTSTASNDVYVVRCDAGKVNIEGNSVTALASGLHRYLADVAHVDVYWSIGSQLHQLKTLLACEPLNGSSIVSWRYHFNTVTFSYTTAFWSWEDWELELDWLALRGVNLPLAWVGYEKILLETFLDAGLGQEQVLEFFSGPAFQAWNRFGNIQSSWTGELPIFWIDSQFELQKKILKRMIELGMTPVLPAFTGFVPRAFPVLFPEANVVNMSRWNGFNSEFSNVTFLEPSDPLFAQLQKSFLQKQKEYYGNITHIYTLDQFNENDPISGDFEDLGSLANAVWQSLKDVDPDAIWMLQGWLFFYRADFWTKERVKAFLDGVPEDNDMLILDLYSETYPQWQNLDSYFGKRWIWCQLHDFGGNQGLYGQVMNVTINSVEALASSASLVGFGLTMEAQEGNEIMYDLLLSQAWSSSPINLPQYFHEWAKTRYDDASSGVLPKAIYETWDTLLRTVYNNTDLTSAFSVPKSIFELAPNETGLLESPTHIPTKIVYDPTTLVSAWRTFLDAADTVPSLRSNVAYQFDLVDLTRQLLANAFYPLYNTFLAHTDLKREGLNHQTSLNAATQAQNQMLFLLTTLDDMLRYTPSRSPESSLISWVNAACSWAYSNTCATDYMARNAINQVTLWGPNGEISDYASRQWAGLVGSYYLPRWQIFTDAYLKAFRSHVSVNQTSLGEEILVWERYQQEGALVQNMGELKNSGELWDVVKRIEEEWCDLLAC